MEEGGHDKEVASSTLFMTKMVENWPKSIPYL